MTARKGHFDNRKAKAEREEKARVHLARACEYLGYTGPRVFEQLALVFGLLNEQQGGESPVLKHYEGAALKASRESAVFLERWLDKQDRLYGGVD